MFLHKRLNTTVNILKTNVQYFGEESFKNFESTKRILHIKLNILKSFCGEELFSISGGFVRIKSVGIREGADSKSLHGAYAAHIIWVDSFHFT